MTRWWPLLVMLVVVDKTYGGYTIVKQGLRWDQCRAQAAVLRGRLTNQTGAILQVECWEEDS